MCDAFSRRGFHKSFAKEKIEDESDDVGSTHHPCEHNRPSHPASGAKREHVNPEKDDKNAVYDKKCAHCSGVLWREFR